MEQHLATIVSEQPLIKGSPGRKPRGAKLEPPALNLLESAAASGERRFRHD